MNTQHTPGPWKPDPAHPTTICQGFNTLAEASLTWGLQKAVANARLIAAAPELLEALITLEEAARISYAHLCSVQERTPEQREAERMHVATVTQKAVEAIAKATQP